MKKRCIAAMLVLVLVAGLLAGCSNPSVQEPASQAASSGDTAPAGTEGSDASAEGVTITFMPTQAGFIDHFDGVFPTRSYPILKPRPASRWMCRWFPTPPTRW